MVGIKSKWVAITDLRSQLAKDVDLRRAGNILEELADELVTTRREVSMKGFGGAPDWYGYETDLWKLSEALRDFYRKNRKLKGMNPLTDAMARLSENVSLGKGRQNFVLMLGEFGRDEYRVVLGRLLGDSDVYGHAIKALCRGKVGGYQEEIAGILESEQIGWIKNAARKYLSKMNSVQ